MLWYVEISQKETFGIEKNLRDSTLIFRNPDPFKTVHIVFLLRLYIVYIVFMKLNFLTFNS